MWRLKTAKKYALAVQVRTVPLYQLGVAPGRPSFFVLCVCCVGAPLLAFLLRCVLFCHSNTVQVPLLPLLMSFLARLVAHCLSVRPCQMRGSSPPWPDLCPPLEGLDPTHSRSNTPHRPSLDLDSLVVVLQSPLPTAPTTPRTPYPAPHSHPQRSNLDLESRVVVRAQEEEKEQRRRAAWIAKEVCDVCAVCVSVECCGGGRRWWAL